MGGRGSRPGSEIAYQQAIWSSNGENVPPPSTDKWKEIERERREKLGEEKRLKQKWLDDAKAEARAKMRNWRP